MFGNTLRLHVVHNGGEVVATRARHKSNWRVSLNGIEKVFSSREVASMSEEQFLGILRDEFGVIVDDLPRLEKGGTRTSPPPLSYYGIRGRGRPRKNPVISTSSQTLEDDEEIVDDLINELN